MERVLKIRGALLAEAIDYISTKPIREAVHLWMALQEQPEAIEEPPARPADAEAVPSVPGKRRKRPGKRPASPPRERLPAT